MANYGECDYEDCPYCDNGVCKYAPDRCYIDADDIHVPQTKRYEWKQDDLNMMADVCENPDGTKEIFIADGDEIPDGGILKVPVKDIEEVD